MRLGYITVLLVLISFSSAEVFETEPADQVVPLQSSAEITFTCKANVHNPVYQWRKDGSRMDTTGQRFALFGGTLTISSPQATDEGKYQCVVTSDDGTVVSNYGSLTFSYVEDFATTSNEPVLTNQGRGVAIRCPNINYAPDYSIRYFWSDLDLNAVRPPGNSTHYISQKDGTLYLANPVVGNTNRWQCVVQTQWELNGKRVIKYSSPIELLVDTPFAKMEPEFLVQPEILTEAVLGGTVLMECFAGGAPTPVITWSKVDSPMPTNYTITPAGQLLLINVTESMAGVYRCDATNSEGTVFADGELSLQYAPVWAEEITSSTADLSTTALWRCGATGKPKPEYKWLKDGNELVNGGRIFITNTQSGSKLEIENVEDADEGMYQCIAVNKHGNIFSSGHLSAKSVAPSFVVEVSDLTKAALGYDVTIACKVAAAPPATITWAKDDVLIGNNNNKYVVEAAGSLVIRNVSASDEGKYTCSARNTLGNISSFGYLQTYEPTILTQRPENVNAVAGDLVSITCLESHDANLNLKWAWEQDGNAIDATDPHYVVSGGQLQLKNVESEQAGMYKCCASTDVGSACATTEVSILAPPDPPTDVTIKSATDTSQHVMWSAPNDNGAPITFYDVEGQGNPDEEWSYLATVNTTHYDVQDLLPFNLYSYRVYAGNKYGRGKASQSSVESWTLPGIPTVAPTDVTGGGGEVGQLVVEWKPLSPTYYGAASVTYEIAIRKFVVGPPVNLPINLDGTPAPPPTNNKPWQYQEESSPVAAKTIFKVNESEIFIPYEVKVRAKNVQGEGPFSKVSIVHTAELPPNEAPTGFKKVWSLAYSAQISWLYVLNRNGFTKGYAVSVCAIIDNPSCDSAFLINSTTKRENPMIEIHDLKPNYSYKLRAAAFNNAGLGPWSDFQFVFTTSKPPPNNPPEYVQMEISANSLTASWKPPMRDAMEPSIKSYLIQYWLMNETSANARDHETANTKVTFDLPGSADYYVWVRAVNEGGPGRPSAEMAVSTQRGTKAGYHGDANAVSWSVSLMLMTMSCTIMNRLLGN